MNKKLTIIIPYRNRPDNLKKFLSTIKKYIKNIDTNILVINQKNDLLFNRGLLINIGIHLSHFHSDYFCFHDVDMLPDDESCNYIFVEGVSRLSTYVSQFKFIERPEHEIGGGVTLIDKESVFKINGYSNEYFGWGAEDNDFYNRLTRENINYTKRFGRYISIPHKKDLLQNMGWSKTKGTNDFVWHNRKLLKKKSADKYSHVNDGLNSLNKFNIKVINENRNADHIFYDIDFDGGEVYEKVLSCNRLKNE